MCATGFFLCHARPPIPLCSPWPIASYKLLFFLLHTGSIDNTVVFLNVLSTFLCPICVGGSCTPGEIHVPIMGKKCLDPINVFHLAELLEELVGTVFL